MYSLHTFELRDGSLLRDPWEGEKEGHDFISLLHWLLKLAFGRGEHIFHSTPYWNDVAKYDLLLCHKLQHLLALS